MMLSTYSVRITADDGDATTYKFLWCDSIMSRLHDWSECLDVTAIEIISDATGEVMFTYREATDPLQGDDVYICPEWSQFYFW